MQNVRKHTRQCPLGISKIVLLIRIKSAIYGACWFVRFDNKASQIVYINCITFFEIGQIGCLTAERGMFVQIWKIFKCCCMLASLAAQDTCRYSQERLAKQPSQRRERPAEETLRIWGEMTKGTEEGFRNCLRFKIDPGNNNGALRDPVAYRCNATPHLHTGSKYKARLLLFLTMQRLQSTHLGC